LHQKFSLGRNTTQSRTLNGLISKKQQKSSSGLEVDKDEDEEQNLFYITGQELFESW